MKDLKIRFQGFFQINIEAARVDFFKARQLPESLYDEGQFGRPASVDRGLSDARTLRHTFDGQRGKPHFHEQFKGRVENRLMGFFASRPASAAARACPSRGLDSIDLQISSNRSRIGCQSRAQSYAGARRPRAKHLEQTGQWTHYDTIRSDSRQSCVRAGTCKIEQLNCAMGHDMTTKLRSRHHRSSQKTSCGAERGKTSVSKETENENLNGWGPLLALLETRQQSARAMGGVEKLQKRRANRVLNARERIDALLDPGSFREIGTLAGGITNEGERPTPGRLSGGFR